LAKFQNSMPVPLQWTNMHLAWNVLNSEPDKNLQSAEEMAARYGVSTSTFLLWFHSKIVPGVQVQRKRHRFDPQQVEAALREHAKTLPQNGAGKFPRFPANTEG
jgi:hypothetical protein